MTAADWAILVPSVVGFLTALTAYFHAKDAKATANAASEDLQKHLQS